LKGTRALDNSTSHSQPPPRTVKYITNPNEVSEASIRGIICNPVHVGVPPYRRIISDAAWIESATQLIEEEGAEQFLVNMLYMLRTSMVDAVPDEAIPSDYDGPWPDDIDEADNKDLADDLDDGISPWQFPLEGFIYCSHDDFPMLVIDDGYVCAAEYLNSHINYSPVSDLLDSPVLTLVFQNGHTLPLLCPDCGESLHVHDDSTLLDSIYGLTIVEMDWNPEDELLYLGFGRLAMDDDDDTYSEPEIAQEITVSLNSVRGLTCPHQHDWDEKS
jgi:hypothetical protein